MKKGWSPEDDKLKDSSTQFPEDYVNPVKKAKEEWNLQYAKAIYWRYLSDKTQIKYGSVDEMRLLRQYGDGQQPKTIYMDALIGKKKKQGNTWVRKGHMNVNWDILSFAPMIRNKIIGMFQQIEYDPQADNIGMDAGDEKQRAKYRRYAQSHAKRKGLTQAVAEFGVPVDTPEFLPENMQQLQLLDKAGGFKTLAETQFQKIVDIGFEFCHWGRIKDKQVADLMDFNHCASQNFFDPDTGIATAKYVDWINLIVSYNRENDFEDIPYWGSIRHTTIHELRKTGQFDEVQLQKIAKIHDGWGGNEKMSNWVDVFDQNRQRFKYDDFNVTYLYCEYKTVDTTFKTLRKNEKGELKYYRSKWGKKGGSKTNSIDNEQVYRCSWIIGTEYCWDYGLLNSARRPTEDTARVSLHVAAISGESITSRAKPLYDDTQITWLKRQNAIAKSAPPGLAIEVGSLSNITIGAKKYKPLELIELRVQGGTLLYKAMVHGATGAIAAQKPIENLPGGMGPLIVEFERMYMQNLNMVRDIIGLAPVNMGSSQDPQVGLGVNQLLEQSTSDTLRPLITAYHRVKSDTAQGIAYRARLEIQNNPKAYKSYYPITGKTALEVVKFTDKTLREMGIKMKARPTETEKQNLMKLVQQALGEGKNGQRGIEIDEAFRIEQFIHNGDLELGRQLLSDTTRTRREKAERQAEKNQAIQAEIDAKRIAAEQQKEIGVHQAKIAAELESSLKLKDKDLELEALKHKHKMAELELEGALEKELGNKQISGEL